MHQRLPDIAKRSFLHPTKHYRLLTLGSRPEWPLQGPGLWNLQTIFLPSSQVCKSPISVAGLSRASPGPLPPRNSECFTTNEILEPNVSILKILVTTGF